MPPAIATPEDLSADQVAQLLAAAQRRPHLADIPWHEDEAVYDGTPVLHRAAPIAVAANDPKAFDPVRRRIRDRYISVRFAGVARSAADLDNPARVMKAARLAYEEQQAEIALELLRLAIGQNGMDPQLRIAELELAWQVHDAHRYVAAAGVFKELFPRSLEWPEVARLGYQLAPSEPMFAGAPRAARAADDRPRWIEPPWDDMAPSDAADFHRVMMQEPSRGH
jgi:hypothetical protein